VRCREFAVVEMARVQLYRGEVRAGMLPRVCMRCGEDADVERKRAFSWNPPWVYLLLLLGLWPCIIVALFTTKKMTVHAPLCQAHKNHWLSRLLFILLSLAVLAILGFVSMIAMQLLDPANGPPRRGPNVGGVFCFVTTALLVVWVVAVIVSNYTAIRPVKITDKAITLAGVCQRFIDALNQDEGDWESSSNNRTRVEEEDDDFDPDLRRRRR
jgi:hypothetical protein